MSINFRVFAVSLFSIILTFSYSHTASAATPISTTISGNVTWTKAAGPYLVSYVSIPTGASLTIEPGTLVYVVNSATPFNIQGTFTVGAPLGEQVIITSENDNGGGVLPQPGDWKDILINVGGVATLTNTTITYGGMPVSCGCGGLTSLPEIENDGGIVTLDHVTLAQSKNYGITQTTGTTTVSASIISDATYGIFSSGGNLELFATTFTNISMYDAGIFGTTHFTNHGANSGPRGLYMAQVVSGQNTWTRDTVPYVIGGFYIPSGAALTILPGAVVKTLSDSYGFTVSGSLTTGAPLQVPVIITSISDDTALGDTNGDGTLTTPAPGAWKEILVTSGGIASFTNTTIKYGGMPISCGCGGLTPLPEIENDGGIVTLDHVTLTESKNDGLTQTSGTTIITNSTLTSLGRFGTQLQGGYLYVSSSTFDGMEEGIFASVGTLELTQNAFTHLSGYAAEVYSTLVNRGGNTGTSAIALRGSTRANTTLPHDGIPYVVASLDVIPGITLTILPGAVFKVLPDAYMSVTGKLISGSPTSTDMVVFTSIKDDSIGGDTNNDGTSTSPTAGDWKSLIFNPGSHATMTNTIIHYGGGRESCGCGGYNVLPSIKNDGGTLTLDHTKLTDVGNEGFRQSLGSTTITNSEIANALYYGVVVTGGTMNIHNSSIHGNQQFGVLNGAATTINATNNWWGAFGGPTHPSNPFGSGDRVSDNVDFGNWLTEEPQGPCLVNCYSNVLFLPGIEASRLYAMDDPNCSLINCENQLWEPNRNDDVRELYLDSNGKSTTAFDIYTRDVMDEVGGSASLGSGSNIYKSFIALMNAMKTTGIINDWEAVPYDWRLSINDIMNSGTRYGNNISYVTPTSRSYIVDELSALAVHSKTGKVTIVAHSNGGLVTKALMLKLKAMGRENLVDQIIFVAVPQVGTPAAIAASLHGYEQDHLFGLITSKRTARTFASTSPMLYHLLPSAGYFNQVYTPVITFDAATLPDWASRYGQTIHSEEGLRNFLVDSYGRVDSQNSDIDHPIQLKDNLYVGAETLHNALDNWAPPTGVTFTQIAGWGIPKTVSGINYTNKITQFCMYRVCSTPEVLFQPEMNFTVDGDGTVVVPSALWTSTTTGVRNYWVDLKKYDSDHKFTTGFGILPFNHSSILEVDGLELFISDIVTRNIKPLAQYNYISTKAPSATTHRLQYSLHSPLTLNLYDVEGRHTGVSTSTGEVEEQIPGTYYAQFGEVKYLFTDASSTGHIVMNGYATGTFTFTINELQGDTMVASTTFKDIPATPQTKVTLDVQSDVTTVSPMSIDNNGDGTIDTMLVPKLNDIVTIPAIKIPLRVTANSKTIILGTTLPQFSATLSGFQGGDTATSSTIGTPSCATTANGTSSVGAYPIICTKGTLASSKYDFTTFATGTLTILYKWSGFTQPINDTLYNPQLPPSVFKGGSTIPVKFQIKNASGTNALSSTSPIWLIPQKGAALSAAVDESVYSDAGTLGSVYRYDTTSQQYIYNWSTKGFATGYWYKIFTSLEDGTTESVVVGIR